VTLQTQAPRDSAAVAIQLFLAHAPQGTAWWDDTRFERMATPAPRPVMIAFVNLLPEATGSSGKSVEEFIETTERVPGPSTKQFGEFARKHKTYLVACLYEREGHVVYNAAVLLGRKGYLVGKYRKVYLPGEEMEQLTPGKDYPVFQTDFGIPGARASADRQR
jgi:hypothetical protein